MQYITLSHVCGFCATGDHDKCATVIGHPKPDHLYRCPCSCERAQQTKCIDCGTRESIPDAVNVDTAKCYDESACTAHREKRRAANRSFAAMDEVYARRAEVKAQEEAERPTRVAKPKVGKCLHCGEATKGGLFLPGHDSKFLSQAVEGLASGKYDLKNTLEAWNTMGISEALQAKLVKRAEAK